MILCKQFALLRHFFFSDNSATVNVIGNCQQILLATSVRRLCEPIECHRLTCTLTSHNLCFLFTREAISELRKKWEHQTQQKFRQLIIWSERRINWKAKVMRTNWFGPICCKYSWKRQSFVEIINQIFSLFFRTKSRNLIFENNDKTQLKYFDASEVCKRCSLPWKDGNLSLQLKQMKMTKRKALKVRLLQEDKSNAKKQKLAKRLSKKANNVIVSI